MRDAQQAIETTAMKSTDTTIETPRLLLRLVTLGDAEFMLRLLNEPSFIQNIGDKRVRTLEDARAYILNGPIESYKTFGFGLMIVELKETGRLAGICGLLKREKLEHVDLGYALLPEFWSKGYAIESASAVIDFAKTSLGLSKVLAITNPDNEPSIKVLEKMGFKYQQTFKFGDENKETKLFLRDADEAAVD